MTNDEAVLAMKECVVISKSDAETGHSYADEILCERLILLGFSDLVTEYKKVIRWYA